MERCTSEMTTPVTVTTAAPGSPKRVEQNHNPFRIVLILKSDECPAFGSTAWCARYGHFFFKQHRTGHSHLVVLGALLPDMHM